MKGVRMTSQTVVFIFGGILMLIGILGGGFEVKELKVPKVAGAARLVSLIAGVVLLGVGITLGNPLVSSPASSRISVVAGSYGQNCGSPHGNVTGHLASECNGRGKCDYIIDYKVIGDPATGCAKDYRAEWKCGDKPMVQSTSASREAGFGTKITLSCP